MARVVIFGLNSITSLITSAFYFGETRQQMTEVAQSQRVINALLSFRFFSFLRIFVSYSPPMTTAACLDFPISLTWS